MKIFILGRHDVNYWYANTVKAFKKTGHAIESYSPSTFGLLGKKLRGTAFSIEQIHAYYLETKIRSFAPDMILVINPFDIAPIIVETVLSTSKTAHKVGWVGDTFSPDKEQAQQIMKSLDHCYVTDTSFMALIEHCETSYLPHACDCEEFFIRDIPKLYDTVFIGSYSKNRHDLLSEVKGDITVMGKAWKNRNIPQLTIPKKIKTSELSFIYSQSRSVLNIQNSSNVISGLNQRSFEPLGCATPVIQDWVDDLPLCFDPEKEMIVYRNVEELNDILTRIKKDPKWASMIGKNGYNRILSEHTYDHRVLKILNSVR